MAEKNVYLLGWEKNFKDSYNYGTRIGFSFNGGAQFSNSLMSPGTAIYTWNSEKSFQDTRNFASLPLLVPGEEYEIRMDYHVVPQNGIYWQLTCCDIDGTVLYDKNFDSQTATFIYPADAYQYSIELVNVRHEKLDFKLLMICRKDLLETNKVSFIDTQINPVLVTKNKLVSDDNIQIVLINRDSATRVYPIFDAGVTICMNLYFLKQMDEITMTREIYTSYQKVMDRLEHNYNKNTLDAVLLNFEFINYAGQILNSNETAERIKVIWKQLVTEKIYNK